MLCASGVSGIDIEARLGIVSVTAKLRDQRLGKVITGKDAFHFSAPVNVTNIADISSVAVQSHAISQQILIRIILTGSIKLLSVEMDTVEMS